MSEQQQLETEPQPEPEAAVPAVHPRTGEVVDLAAATTTDLADLRDALLEHEHGLAAVKRRIDAELCRRLDFEGKRSARVGPYKLTASAPVSVEWDAEAAASALRRLVRAGALSAEAAAEAVTRVTTYKPVHGKLNALLRHADERVREAVAECKTERVNDRRRVGVERLP
jgi:hypothetical protein